MQLGETTSHLNAWGSSSQWASRHVPSIEALASIHCIVGPMRSYPNETFHLRRCRKEPAGLGVGAKVRGTYWSMHRLVC